MLSLNQQDAHPWQHMLKAGDEPTYCETNVDDQMILNVGFREKVKVYSISFKAQAEYESSAPLNVRIYANKSRRSLRLAMQRNVGGQDGVYGRRRS